MPSCRFDDGQLSIVDREVHQVSSTTIQYDEQDPAPQLDGYVTDLYTLWIRTYTQYRGTWATFWSSIQHLLQLIIAHPTTGVHQLIRASFMAYECTET